MAALATALRRAPSRLLICLFVPLTAAADGLSAAQQTLLEQAATAFAQGHDAPATADLPQLSQTFMAPWVAYWSLQPHLKTLDNAQFDRFQSRYQGTAAYLLLRRQWLLQLGKRQDWTHFTQVYAAGPASQNPSLRCYVHLDPSLSNTALGTPLALWQAAPAGDQACDAMARSALQTGSISPAQLWGPLNRLVRAQAVSTASRFSQYLPGAAAQAAADLLRQPRAWIQGPGTEATAAYGPQTGAKLLTLALLATVRQHPDWAVAQAQTLPGLEPAQRAEVLYSAAHRAARQLQDRALRWYLLAQAQGGSYQADGPTLAWMVRAALRQQDWSAVLSAISAMPPAQASSGEWVFWRALALQQTGHGVAARSLWQTIASPWTYSGQLALAALHQPLILPKDSPTPAPTPSVSVPYDRAIELYRLGLYFDALWEWNRYLDSLPNVAGIRAAAQRAAADQAWLLVINASTRAPHGSDWRQGFPLPYRETVQNAAVSSQLSTAFVNGLIRQESGFAPGIQSAAGAQGIMQVMPATAAWVQSHYPATAASDPQSTQGNIVIGAHYLAYLEQQFGGSPLLTAAAYNAGPGAVNRWLQSATNVPEPWRGAIFVSNIPYRQTRHYVADVLSNTAVYQAILDVDPPDVFRLWHY